MSTYLTQFVNDVSHINEFGGVKWQHPVTKAWANSKLFPVICSSDAPARCMLQGTQQFNGEYGCRWCLNPGHVVEKGRGFTRSYSCSKCAPRTHRSVIEHGRQVVSSAAKHVMGVKTLSPLILLAGFDVVRSFTVDYMHCVLLGCVRQF
jgi:hypothetical protein